MDLTDLQVLWAIDFTELGACLITKLLTLELWFPNHYHDKGFPSLDFRIMTSMNCRHHDCTHLTLPWCRIPKDVGLHGSPVFSPARHLQQFHRSPSSSNSFRQAIQKYNSRTCSSSSAIQLQSHAIIIHLLTSHYVAQKPQLPPSNHSLIISLLPSARFKTSSLLTLSVHDILSILL